MSSDFADPKSLILRLEIEKTKKQPVYTMELPQELRNRPLWLSLEVKLTKMTAWKSIFRKSDTGLSNTVLTNHSQTEWLKTAIVISLFLWIMNSEVTWLGSSGSDISWDCTHLKAWQELAVTSKAAHSQGLQVAGWVLAGGLSSSLCRPLSELSVHTEWCLASPRVSDPRDHGESCKAVYNVDLEITFAISYLSHRSALMWCGRGLAPRWGTPGSENHWGPFGMMATSDVELSSPPHLLLWIIMWLSHHLPNRRFQVYYLERPKTQFLNCGTPLLRVRNYNKNKEVHKRLFLSNLKCFLYHMLNCFMYLGLFMSLLTCFINLSRSVWCFIIKVYIH